MNCTAVIPARYASQRLPGKLLLPLGGKPIIQHVWERARRCPVVDEVIVATDDARIVEAVAAFGGRAVMTSPDHTSGTDRIAEALAGIDTRIAVNVQGDEPLIDPATIAAAVAPLLEDRGVCMATACTAIRSADELFDPNCVKVILNADGDAIYFSRLPIPFIREPGLDYASYREHIDTHPLLLKNFYRHIGLYAYQTEFLKIFVNLPASSLERMEKLEQLRALEHGYAIRVVEVRDTALGVDTEADYQRIKAIVEGA
ncbi:MAG TPA: 3-deoxy-manno-octulosonate cytidylyltransferase [Acidobacteriota bacterium]|nr:3-deoxy-manno-octulosonate cytidylyltransferase [Acidobacteriota bacterium]HQM63946.1 3-deoxy-manno-octulosonate cytidylyltransferase [Acidobacteriota bacterium]